MEYCSTRCTGAATPVTPFARTRAAVYTQLGPDALRCLATTALLLTVAFGCAEGRPDRLPLWHVRNPAHPNASVHVLATVALSQQERLEFDGAVMEAFERADRLVLPNSAVLSKQNALIGWKAHLAEADLLSNWLSPEIFAGYVEAVGRAGFEPTFADVTAPWFASRMVRSADWKRTGFVPERQIEVYFVKLAQERAQPKPILPLEESAVSYDRHVALAPEIQSLMMERALYESERAEDALPAAAASWRSGDVEELDRILRSADLGHPEIAESRRLTINRESARLADAIVDVLSDATPQHDFLVVDARYLLGEQGVLELLQSRGLEVTAVPPQGEQASPYPAPPLPDSGSAGRGGRVLLIGIDGASLQVIGPLLDAGRLPNLRAIARAGVSGLLRSHRPIYSPRIWNSIATGKTPEHHGIEGFTFEDEDGKQQLFLGVHRKAHALWNIASDAGKKVAVVNWWNTYPPEVINGVMISDHAKPTRLAELGRVTGAETRDAAGASPATVFPASYRDRVARIYAERLGIPGSQDPFLGNLGIADWMQKEELSKRFRDDASAARIALEIEADLHPDLMMVFLPGIDRVSHRLWGAIEPPDRYAKPLDMNPRQREAARDALHAYYEYSDALVGLLAASYGDSDLVVVVSDHGFEAGEHLGDLTGVHNSEAAIDGILFARGPGITRGRDSGTPSVNDVTPTILAWLGVPLGEDMDGSAAPFLVPATPVTTIASHDTGDVERLGAAPSGSEEEILDQLRALGYIE